MRRRTDGAFYLNRRATLWAWTGIAVALMVAGCAPARPGPGSAEESRTAPATPKRIVAGILSVPPTIDPYVTPGITQPGQAGLHSLVHVGLSIADDAGRLSPALAEAVPSVDNGLWRLLANGRMETMWKIRPDALWHDETGVTADDMVFTATVGRDRDLPLSPDFGYDSVESIEAVDSRTLKVTWKQPYIDADNLFLSPLPKHLLEPQYANDKSKLVQHRYWTEEFVGTGPYKLRSWVSGSSAVLQANEKYVLGRPKIDEIEVKFLADPSTMAANLLAGSLDLTLGKGLSLDQALQLESQWQAGHMETAAANAIFMYPQLLNSSPAIVSDVRFRKALMHATDRQELVDTIMYGRTTVAHNYFSPSTPEYEDTLDAAVQYPVDPAQFARMAEALGYTKGADGQLRDGQGPLPAVEIRANDVDTNTKVMFAIADQWQRLGVKVEPVVIVPERRSDAAWIATFPAFYLNRMPSDLVGLKRMHRNQTPLPENGFRGGNYSRYQNPDLSDVVDRIYVTIPRAERLDLIKQSVRLVTDQLIRMGLFYDVQATLIANGLHSVSPGNSTGGSVWNAQQWSVD